MRVCIVSILCIFILSVDASVDDFQLEGHYWRDYANKIPKDALPGGINAKGKVTYVGQVLHGQLLIPAEISPEENRVAYEWGYQEFLATKNIKILCTQYPERFEWIRTGNGLIQNVQNKNLVIGGYEAEATIYVGRKLLADELSVGKVISTKKQSTLNTTKRGKVTQHAEFDILSYNPDIETNQNNNESSGTTCIGATGSEIENLKCGRKTITINLYN